MNKHMGNKRIYFISLFLFLFLFSFSFISAWNFESGGTVINQNITVNGTHNQLAGIQGGSAGEYYHLNQTVYNAVQANYSLWITSAGADTFINNYSDFLTTKNYALNDSRWTLNYSNMSIGWLYATNSTGGLDSFVANYTNFSNIYGNVTDYNASWTNRTNLSYYLTTNPFSFYNVTTAPIYLNDTFAGNYSNFTVGWNYATNSTGGGISWATAYNGTLAKTDASNSFGDFNQSMNVSTFFLWSLLQRVGIKTNSPQNTLNVIGDGNFTSALYTNNKNLEVGYDYAINSTGGADTFIANYTNFTRIYANVTDYNTSWSSITNNSYVTYANWNATNTSYLLTTNTTYSYSLNNTFVGNATAGNNYITNGTGGAYIYHNGTGWVIKG